MDFSMQKSGQDICQRTENIKEYEGHDSTYYSVYISSLRNLQEN